MDVGKSNTKAAVLFLDIAAILIVGIARAIVAFVHEGRRERDRRMSDVLGLPCDGGVRRSSSTAMPPSPCSSRLRGKGLTALLLEGEAVVSPALLCAEVAHVLEKRVRGGSMSAAEAQAMGRMCLALVDELVPDADLWEEVLPESLRLGRSPYDLF